MSCKKETYKRLGDYIREVDVRNSAMEVNLSQGICNMKYFQDPRQVSSTPHLDKIVRTGQFAYNRATTRNGNKISIAYREGADCTVSSAYCVFYITDENVLNPYYLWLWFKRPDFDRYAIFKSHGSAHEFFEFETLCNTYVPMPPIEEQRKIVENYLAIQTRIENNKKTIAKLEETAQAIYRKMFVDDIDPENLPEGWRMGTLSDVANISSGTTCKNKSASQDSIFKYPVAGAAGIIGYSSDFNNDKRLLTTGRVGTLGVTCRYNENVWYADNVLVIEPKSYEYVYQIINNLDFNVLIKFGVQSLITQSGLKEYPTIIPPNNLLVAFETKVKILFNHIELLKKENDNLDTFIANYQNHFA